MIAPTYKARKSIIFFIFKLFAAKLASSFHVTLIHFADFLTIFMDFTILIRQNAEKSLTLRYENGNLNEQ
jgi:hypothetical protein